MKNTLLCLLFFCWGNTYLAPGQNSISSTKPIEINITKALKTQKSLKMSQLVKDVDFILMDNNPKCYMTGMTEFTLGKKYIMAAFGSLQPNTTHLVHIFNRDGTYIRSLGSEGKGPGEYIPPFKAIMDPNEEFVLIIDANQKKLIQYSLDGKLIREQKYSDNNSRSFPHPSIDNNGQVYLYFKRPYRSVDNFSSVVKYNKLLQPVQNILKRENNQDQTLALVRNEFSATPDHMLFWESYWDTVYYINSSGQSEAKYHFTITKNQWPKEYLTDYAVSRPHFDEYTTVTGIQDLSNYLIIGIRNKYFNQVVYDKSTGESYSLTNSYTCYTSGGNETVGSIENDLFGLENLGLGTYIPEQKLFVVQANPLYLLVGGQNPECLRKKKVLFPEKMNFLIDYAQKATGEEGPLLIIMHAK